MRLKGSTVVITGASSGIGRAAALAFADRGADLVLAARRQEALEEVARECRARGADAVAAATDMADPEAVEDLARRAIDRHGRIDVWVNNAAVTSFGSFLDTPLTEIRRIVDVNLMGYVHGARAALSHFHERGRGSLINVSSVVGVVSQPYTHAYCMTKFAIRSLSASLRQELLVHGAKKIHVCSVLPATIDTPIFTHAANHTGRRVVPMSPVYSPERAARAIVDLVRKPRREVVVGPAGRGLVVQSSLSPGAAERMMGSQVERSHLSDKEPEPDGSGNLFQPAEGTGSVHGGWGGRRRTGVRRVALAALVATAAALVIRRRRRWAGSRSA